MAKDEHDLKMEIPNDLNVKVIIGRKLTSIDKDASEFWSQLMTTFTSTMTEAVFCTEEAVASKLTPLATRRLTSVYSELFHAAGPVTRNSMHIYQLLRSAYGRQLKAERALTDRRRAALLTVMSVTFYSPEMGRWITALENLLEAQRLCQSPLDKSQVREAVFSGVQRYHGSLLGHNIWALSSADTKDLIVWLHEVYQPLVEVTHTALRNNRFCVLCRTRYSFGQHVSEPPAKPHTGNRSPNRNYKRPKAARAIDFRDDSFNDSMVAPLIYDTGATHSIFNSRNTFADYQTIDGKDIVVGGGSAKFVEKGTAKVRSSSHRTIKLPNSYHVPTARDNLLSHDAIANTDLNLAWTTDKGVAFAHSDGAPALHFERRNRRLIQTHSNPPPTTEAVTASASTHSAAPDLHAAFGHPGRDAGHRIARKLGVKYQHPDQCKVCSKAKMTVKPHRRSKSAET
ncbi:hypothetical protein SEPCBS57363_003749 [Sporothrix epigloea]|uniref:Retrovirus-related Pol polyprotein from transposon TNT 1-94-like beta-barrel domain-containing protein n=1 Tax=Sporothrix epigloea TaxID=1892477 RepID=A0ABP0DRU0_9PEZI